MLAFTESTTSAGTSCMPVLLFGVRGDLAEDLVVGLAGEGGGAAGDDRAAGELLHSRLRLFGERATLLAVVGGGVGILAMSGLWGVV